MGKCTAEKGVKRSGERKKRPSEDLTPARNIIQKRFPRYKTEGGSLGEKENKKHRHRGGKEKIT